MQPMTKRLTLIIACLAFTAAVATGCGRRASLDTPAQASQSAGQAQQEDETDSAGEEKPDRPFILDGLIE